MKVGPGRLEYVVQMCSRRMTPIFNLVRQPHVYICWGEEGGGEEEYGTGEREVGRERRNMEQGRVGPRQMNEEILRRLSN